MQANRIDEWLATENRLDEIPARPDTTASHPARTSGLALLRSALDGTGLNASIGRTLDFRLVEVEHGRAVFQGAPSQAHYNPLGTVHGGWFAACSIRRWAVPCTAPWTPGSPTPRWS